MTLAMVFPGQGSQSQGMLGELASEHAAIKDTFREASEVLGYDLWELVQDGPVEKLDETTFTQPAMLAAGVATWRVWQAEGGKQPAAMAGHSLGEYTALVCAGAIDFTEAVRLVKIRAQLMHNAVPPGEGAMAAILGLDDQAVRDVCSKASSTGIAEAANFNSPGQVVVAGERAAIEQAIELAREAGARRAIMLAVSVPSHSSLMQDAGEALAESLETAAFNEPPITVINAVDAVPYGDADDIRARLARQIASPVRWVDTVQRLVADGADRIVECGPGKVLVGLIKRIDRSLPAICIDSPDSLGKAMEEGA
ncbi:MAG: ACP S-malonyltransferase [Woeseiaceae bacterium]|nr:ACP S-malonyltransferase [Woeseiaceae bacterium]